MPSTPGRSADETTTRSPTGVDISAAPLMPRSVVCLPVESARATTCAEASLPCTMMAPHPAERRGEKTMLAIRVPHNEVEVALRLR